MLRLRVWLPAVVHLSSRVAHGYTALGGFPFSGRTQIRTAPQIDQGRLLWCMSDHSSKRLKTSPSTCAMMSTGVDIRVPSDWIVTSKAIEDKKCIGTHNGTFHCDEALACAMLKILPAWSGAVIVRTRDEEELAKCNVVVDVGGIYDPKTLRFDHHQKTFSDTLSEESFSTKLSSAGLVYRHFGHEILTRMVEGTSIPKEVVNKKFYGRVYKSFVEHIDGIDNGIMVADGMMKYQVSSTLSDRVAKLNPHWNEEAEDGPLLANERFKQAMSLASGEFIETVLGLSNSWWPGRAIVQDSISMRKEAHPSGQVVVLTGYCPWKSHLVEIEEEMGLGGEFKYVLYAEGGNSKSWRIQAVPLVEGSFELRLGLPKEWRGLRNAELSTASGIEGCVFVHANGFIGANATKEGALAMASKALEIAAST